MVAMRVLVVEDDRSIAEFVATGLRQEGYAVDVAATGVEGLDLAQAAPYDAAVVDVMLPRLDGLSLVGALRRAGVRTPVLFLSARHTVDDRVKGLQAGGDDYLTKPFAFAELLARVQAITRRSTPGRRIPRAQRRRPDGSIDCRAASSAAARRSSCGRASTRCSST